MHDFFNNAQLIDQIINWSNNKTEQIYADCYKLLSKPFIALMKLGNLKSDWVKNPKVTNVSKNKCMPLHATTNTKPQKLKCQSSKTLRKFSLGLVSNANT